MQNNNSGYKVKQKVVQSQKQKTGNVGKAMQSLSREAVTVRKAEQLSQEVLRQLVKPRSREYIDLVQKNVQIMGEIEECRKQLGAMNGSGGGPGNKSQIKSGSSNTGKNPGGVSSPSIGEIIDDIVVVTEDAETTSMEVSQQIEETVVQIPEWLKEKPKTKSAPIKSATSQQENVQVSTVSSDWMSDKSLTTRKKTESWMDMTVAGTKTQKQELEERLNKLEQELARNSELLKAMAPVGSRMLGLLYMDDKISDLKRKGVITSDGRPYFSPEDLINKTSPDSKQEEKSWLKGDEVLNEVCLNVEVYLYAVCEIMKDGSVRVYRGY